MNSPHPTVDQPAEPGRGRGDWGLWGGAVLCAAAAGILLLPAGTREDTAGAPQPSSSSAPTVTVPISSEPPGPNEVEVKPEPNQQDISVPASTTPTAPASPQTGTDADIALDEEQWRTVAVGFATDFATPGPDATDWLARVSRWTTAQLAEQYKLVDHTRIPGGRLTALEADAIGEHVVEFTAHYDSGLVVGGRAVTTGTTWQISAAAPG